jgi:tRNA-dihydrouridine synthase A
VKCRIGVDEQDSYEQLHHFIHIIASTGCHIFIVHARKAWLKGLSPKQNRHIPPLLYDRVVRLKKDFPALTIIINGGIISMSDIQTHLLAVAGVMIGRIAYTHPYLLADIQAAYYPNKRILTRTEVIEAMFPYIMEQLQQGVKLPHITRHLFGLFQGERGAAGFRRHLSQHTYQSNAGIEVLQQALHFVKK